MAEPRRRRRRGRGGSSAEAVAAARFRQSDMRQWARERLRRDWWLANAPDSYVESLIDDPAEGSREPYSYGSGAPFNI